MFIFYFSENPMDENKIRRYISDTYFDVNGLLEYIDKNEILRAEEILSFSKGVRYTKQLAGLLYTFDTITRTNFIERLPIYFYDLNNRNNSDYRGIFSMASLFDSYQYILPRKYTTFEDPVFADQFIVNKKKESELLINSLLKIYNVYKIDFSDMFNYLFEIVDSYNIKRIFETWCMYLDYATKNGDGTISKEEAFPFNLYYSLNKKLVESNKEPIMYCIEETDYEEFYTYSPKGSYVQFEGDLPFDENYKINFDWVGLWFTNIVKIESEIKKPLSDARTPFYHGKGRLNIRFRVYVDVNSVIMMLNDDDEETVDTWKQIYCGSNLIKFNPQFIVKQREQLGLQQQEAAKMLSINLRTYQRIENGESLPDAINLMKIMQTYDIKSPYAFYIHRKIEDPELKLFKSKESLNKLLEIDNDMTPKSIMIMCPYCGKPLGFAEFGEKNIFGCKLCNRKFSVEATDKDNISISVIK